MSKATVRMAITDLVRNGSLRKQQGKGTFVVASLPDLGIAMKTRPTEEGTARHDEGGERRYGTARF